MKNIKFPVEISEKFLEKAEKLNINPEEIREFFVRGSGKGGQKINKTSSCVVLVHQPTKIETKCQRYREQSKNRISAYKLLILKIEEKLLGEESEKARKIFRLRKQKQRRSKKAKEKILEQKRLKAGIKETRKDVL